MRILVVVLFLGSMFGPQLASFAVQSFDGDPFGCETHAFIDVDQQHQESDHSNHTYPGVLTHCAGNHVYCGPPAMGFYPSVSGSMVVRTDARLHPSRTESVELHPPRS